MAFYSEVRNVFSEHAKYVKFEFGTYKQAPHVTLNEVDSQVHHILSTKIADFVTVILL